MSDPRLDALAETARNRGLRLVRSRVRTPGKRRYGKAGLTDAAGKPVFGMDSKGPIETPDAVEAYLRTLEVQDWGASLKVAGRPRSRPSGEAAKAPESTPVQPGRLVVPEKPPTQRPAPPKPIVRDARPGDAARLAELIGELGHRITLEQVRRNLAQLSKSGEVPLVAAIGLEVVGVCGVGRRVVLARPAPLGRISTLIVTGPAQGRGIGRMLVEAAEAWMRSQGCELVEVTSNDRRAEAHAFYRHMGYERTSIRFAKTLAPEA